MTKTTPPAPDAQASTGNEADVPAGFHGRRYHAYNDWARMRHGGRLQKISVDAGFTCPNRDGALGRGGCSFCNNAGFTPGYLREQPDIRRQIDTGIAFMRRRYPQTAGFLAYFQSYSNTYGELAHVRRMYGEALAHPDIRGLAIGTRPDCLPDATLDYLAELARTRPIELEIGIESCNDAVLKECRRGHDFACSADAIRRAAQRGLFVTGHLLLGLPRETPGSLVEGARALARLPIDALKFHQLQIVRGTRLAVQYRRAPDSIGLLSPAEYLDAVIDMLERLPPSIKIQRLGSEVPPNLRLSPDWGLRLSRFPALLDARLHERGTWQGRRFRLTPEESAEGEDAAHMKETQ